VNEGKRFSPEAAISGCTAVINSGREWGRSLSIAYMSRGLAYKANGDLDRALADYTKAIELDPKDAYAYYNRGLHYRAKGDLDHAIADYRKAIELDPKDALRLLQPRQRLQ